jgi:hypothetical protein
MPQLAWTQHWTAADQQADLGFRITRELTGYVVRAGRHGKEKDWAMIETCRTLDGAQRGAQAYLDWGFYPRKVATDRT